MRTPATADTVTGFVALPSAKQHNSDEGKMHDNRTAVKLEQRPDGEWITAEYELIPGRGWVELVSRNVWAATGHELVPGIGWVASMERVTL